MGQTNLPSPGNLPACFGCLRACRGKSASCMRYLRVHRALQQLGNSATQQEQPCNSANQSACTFLGVRSAGVVTFPRWWFGWLGSGCVPPYTDISDHAAGTISRRYAIPLSSRRGLGGASLGFFFSAPEGHQNCQLLCAIPCKGHLAGQKH